MLASQCVLRSTAVEESFFWHKTILAKQEGFSNNLGRNLIVQAVELLREAPGFANM